MKIVEVLVALAAFGVASGSQRYFDPNGSGDFTRPLETTNPDAYGNFTEYAERYGFTTETHEIVTEDGYILVAFRITGIKGGASNIGKPVVFFQHGLLDQSDTWIVNDPDMTPGFQMARAGFDCWFGNSRGNKYSRTHEYLSRWSEEFWEFTWQHMAEFDVPANVNYVLEKTGQEKLTWIGHSQGTAIMFAHLSEVPDFADKLHLYVALAPIASVTYMSSKALSIVGNTPLAQIMQFLHMYDFLPWMDIPTLEYDFCYYFSSLCADAVHSLDGDISVDNLDRFPVIVAHEPGGTSVRNMELWEQGIHHNSSAFCKFDYGELTNMRVYHNITAPCYDLSAIKAPVAWWVGNEDALADPRDVEWLRQQLSPGVLVKDTTIDKYGHITMVAGKNMSYFDDVIALTKEYSGLSIEESSKFLS